MVLSQRATSSQTLRMDMVKDLCVQREPPDSVTPVYYLNSTRRYHALILVINFFIVTLNLALTLPAKPFSNVRFSGKV